ncbi:MAG: hypothetical protein HWE08_06920 [Alphaproteobacteria bacterium]|nr:hypothetical protein [Alphaproteobacteria bacterium]
MQKQLVMNDDLLHYIMTEMYNKMLEYGDLKTLENVTTRVLETFNKRDLETLTVEQIYHYTGAMLRYGQNLDRQGNSIKAREIFDQVLVLSRDFYEQYPNSFEATFRLQNNLFFTGYLARRQGRFDDAEQNYRERLALNSEAYKQRDNLTFMETTHVGQASVWAVAMSDSLRSLANVLAGPKNKPKEALPLALSSIEILEKMPPKDRNPNGYPYNLGSSYYYAADTYLLLGQLDKAEKLFARRQAVFEALVAQNPKNSRAFRRILTSKEALAKIAQLRGEQAKAYNLRREIADGFDILTQKDPSNTLWLGDSAKGQINLAQSAFLLQDLETAATYQRKAKLQITEALERDNTRPQRWLTYHRTQSLEAEIDHAKGDTSASQQKLVALLAELEQKDTAYLTMAGTKEHLADTRLFYGQLLADNGKEQAAKTQWQKLVDLLENSSSSIDLVGKETLSVAYNLLGEQDRALALAQELDRYGYQRSNLLSHNKVSQR